MALAAIAAAALGGLALVAGQAAWVRRRTPRLPEAGGPRLGVSGDNPSLRILVTGESPAAGVGVADQRLALAGQLSQALNQQHKTPNHWCVAARSGLVASQLPALLADAPSRFDVVVVVLGVNDSTVFRSRRAFRADIWQIRQVLRERHPRAMLLWCGIPPLGRFPALPWPLAGVLAWRSRALDAELKRLCQDPDSGRHVPVSVRGAEDFAADGFHPGDRGYRDWGARLAHIIAEGITTQ